ncbi:DOMON domain-containing protein frrs1L [Boothiomyces sp. JEL0838]|nr:DOMON domain-containing protein frrs1L [Boothiomyces sp. JEL0838]
MYLLLLSVVYSVPVCPISNGFCVVTEAQGSNTCFTIHSKYDGWNGIGVGSTRMAGADMYIGWTNSTGGITIGNFEGSGHTQPNINSIQNQFSVSVPKVKPSWSGQSFYFCRPTTLTLNGKSITESAGYIFAGSNSKPNGNVDKTGVTFVQHDVMGTFTPSFSSPNSNNSSNTGQGGAGSDNNGGSGTFTQPILTPSSSFPYQKIVILHGILMFIAWVISPFIGIYIARYMKSTLGHTWYILHVFFMAGLTACATIASFILIFLYSSDRFASVDSRVGDVHEKLGLIVTIAVVVQVLLGYISNAKYDPNRTSIPWFDIAHWWVGRILFLFGLLNAFFGILFYKENYTLSIWVFPIFWTIIGFGTVMFTIGQFTIGQDNHISNKTV